VVTADTLGVNVNDVSRLVVLVPVTVVVEVVTLVVDVLVVVDDVVVDVDNVIVVVLLDVIVVVDEVHVRVKLTTGSVKVNFILIYQTLPRVPHDGCQTYAEFIPPADTPLMAGAPLPEQREGISQPVSSIL
jgi:hypothetical protein